MRRRRSLPTLPRLLFWLLLSLPAIGMALGLARGRVPGMDLLPPSGETAARLLVLALLPGPLAGAFGAGRFLRGWLALRRNLGVAAFAYGLLHLLFYLADMGAVAPVLDELGLPSIWTGWLALVAMVPPAALSFDAALRRLGWRRWKAAQRLVYAAALLTLAHWLLLDWKWQPPLAHAAPLVIAWALLWLRRRRPPGPERNPA
jgi:sulfoxide reductase heme-binding subunit YedZ